MPEKKHKKILLIAYHFPPSIAVGGIRIAGFAKYLPLYEWSTYVLTIKEYYLKKADRARLEELGSIKIIRTIQLPTLRQVYLKVKTAFHSLFKGRHVSLDELESGHVQSSRSNSVSGGISQKIKSIINLFLILPDLERRWVIPAVFRALIEIRREKIDCILTSCPPYSVHLIGLLIKMLTGIKWIADFRDPWMTPFSGRHHAICDSYMKIESWLEKKVIQKADLVLTNTEVLYNIFKESYSTLPQSKFLYINNGFDSEVLSSLNNSGKYGQFTLAYTGTLYLGRSPEPVFKAIKELIEDHKLDQENIKVKLVGDCNFIDGYPTERMIQSYGLDDVVDVSGQVSYSSALDIIKKSHVALLFAPAQPVQIPGKVYDYIGSGTKILALTEKGATADLINSTGVGSSFEPSDTEGIKSFIHSMISNGNLSIQQNLPDVLDQFDRKKLVENLADHLNKLA